jgi:hypothetical protein
MQTLQKIVQFVVENQIYIMLGLFVIGLLGLAKLLMSWVRKSVIKYGFIVWEKKGGRWYNEGHAYHGLKIKWPFLSVHPRFISEEDLGEETFDKEIRPLSKFEVDDQTGEPRLHQPQWEDTYGNKYALTQRNWKPWRYWIPHLRIAALLGLMAVFVLSVVHFWPETDATVSHEDVGGPHATVEAVEAEVEATVAPTEPTPTAEPEQTEEPTPEPDEERQLVIDLTDPPVGPEEQIISWLEENIPTVDLPTINTNLDLPWVDKLFRNADSGRILRFERGLVILVARQRGEDIQVTMQYTDYDLNPIGDTLTVNANKLSIRGGEFNWGIRIGKDDWKVSKYRRGSILVQVNSASQYPLSVTAQWFRWWYAVASLVAAVAIFVAGRKSY